MFLKYLNRHKFTLHPPIVPKIALTSIFKLKNTLDVNPLTHICLDFEISTTLCQVLKVQV